MVKNRLHTISTAVAKAARAVVHVPWVLYLFYVLVSPFMLVGFTAGVMVGFVIMAVGAIKLSWRKGLEVFNGEG